MSNPYDPSQPDHQQQWGQSPNPQQPGQGYDAGTAHGAPQPPPYGQDQQWGAPQGGAQQWNWQQQEPPQPTRIDWNSAPPQADQAPWRGPAAFAPPAPPAPEPQQFAPPAGHDQPWVSGGSAQTAQEVADHWQSSQEAQQAAPQPFQASPAPVAEHYQPPAEQYQPPVADYQAPPQHHQQAPQHEQQWPSYDAPAQHQDTSFNEAATVTTPAIQDPVAEQEPEPEALTIGRGRENSIVLDDMLVSRHHVRITADADGLILEDLGSRNGTYVNGRRVERTHLSEGDRIGIGAATFEVRDGWLLNV
ncbi:MAG TPA: FHA domain-containing protein [Flexivirga sp.]|uniref:FHA domain-containing protein n=1 Tax=Flexivirga sp. TaxID=1962927 RepID=UPI002D101EBA|nr:FHA domain-containing protein [Flexivirga sp.]HWC21356.1 FHA domain-containing protein [Flexivirga sp.]